MSDRRAFPALRRLLLGAAASMTLLALAACATGAAGQRPSAPPPDAASPSATVTPPPAPAAPEAPAPGAPDSPAATGGGEAPPATATTAPSAPVGPVIVPAADKTLCSCTPARRARPKHPKPKEPREPPTPAGPPPPVPADAVVDARVGEVGTSLGSILGRDVASPKGEDLGRVVDVLADAQGHVRVAIIDFGGFLGVGTRRIAVDWPLLRFDLNARDKPLILSVDRQKLQSAPEYNPNKPRVLMPPAAPDAPDAGQTKK